MIAQTIQRRHLKKRAAGAAALGFALVAGVAWAGEFNPLGDGSGSDNADLLRDPTTGCENCEPMPPHEWQDPPFSIDWSLALRGAYVRDGGGEHFEMLAVPSVSFAHEFLRGSVNFDASAELSKSSIGDYQVNSVDLGLAAAYDLNADTRLNGSASLSFEQDSPQAVSGKVAAGVDRNFGLLTVGLRGDATRSVYLPDADGQNNWRVGTGLRVGYKVTPLLTAFVDGSAGYQLYDGISPSYGVKLDAADYAIRTGLSAKWTEVLEAEASVGLGLRRFADPGFAAITTNLYDASLTFRPDETLTLKAGFSTSVDAPGPDSPGAARIAYAATGDAEYQVNPWLKLRTSAAYGYATFVGSAETETGYDLGTGLDYLLNEYVTMTADYAYANTIATPDPAEEEHRVTLGVTLKR